MNKIITIQFIVILMACLLSPNSIMAGNETVYTVSMQKHVKRQSEHNKSLDCEGRRTPSMPIYCIISRTNGLNIVGIFDDIISYEVCEISSGINIASFSEESEFLAFLLCQIGNFQIKFETENYTIVGYITTD